MKEKRLSSKVYSKLRDKLYDKIMDNVVYEGQFHAHIEEHADKIYELDCDITIQYAEAMQFDNEPPQNGKVCVACDTYSLTSIDDNDKVLHYDESAERIINDVINLI